MVGKRVTIKAQGLTLTGVIDSFFDSGPIHTWDPQKQQYVLDEDSEDRDINIEFTLDNGEPRYWKKRFDGGSYEIHE